MVHGDADTVLPVAHAHALAGGIPNSDLIVLAGRGHLPRPAEWDTIAELVAAHISRTAPT